MVETYEKPPNPARIDNTGKTRWLWVACSAWLAGRPTGRDIKPGSLRASAPRLRGTLHRNEAGGAGLARSVAAAFLRGFGQGFLDDFDQDAPQPLTAKLRRHKAQWRRQVKQRLANKKASCEPGGFGSPAAHGWRSAPVRATHAKARKQTAPRPGTTGGASSR